MSTIGNPLPYTNENDMEIDNDTDMNALPTVGDGERVQVKATPPLILRLVTFILI